MTNTLPKRSPPVCLCLSQISRAKHVFDKRTLLSNFFIVSMYGKIHQKVILILSKLQSVQNFPARIATSTRKYDHITPVATTLGMLSWPLNA